MKTITLIVIILINYKFAHNAEQNNDDGTITKLDLSNRGLQSLKDYNFSKYPALEEIDLSNNKIRHIKEKIFAENTKLVKVNLSGNKKLSLPNYSTLLIANIQELCLSNCDIKKLPQNIFDGLRYLKIIDLSNNPITKKGMEAIPFYTIEALEKLVLPLKNEKLLKTLCNDFNITLEIKNEEIQENVECDVYRQMKDDTENESDDDDDNEEDEEEMYNEESGEKSIDGDEEIIHAVPASLFLTEENDKPQELNNNSTNTSKNDESKIDVVEPLVNASEKTNHTHFLEPRANDKNEGENDVTQKPEVPETDEDLIIYEIAENKPTVVENNDTNNTDTSDKKDIQVVAVNVPNPNDTNAHLQPRVSNATDAVNESTTIEQNVDNIGVPTVSANNTNTEEVKLDEKPVLKNETQRIVVPETNKSEKMQINESEKPAAVTESSNTGSTILIVLVIAVVISGLAAFGYKFYKNRRYQAAKAVVQPERELKEIVVNNKPSHSNTKPEVSEQEPLMNNHLNTENGENKIKTSINNLSTGPYMPTTTTFKPVDKTNDVK